VIEKHLPKGMIVKTKQEIIELGRTMEKLRPLLPIEVYEDLHKNVEKWLKEKVTVMD
jgi:hypothetical protein